MVASLGELRTRVTEMKVFASRRNRRRFLLHALLAAIGLVGVTVLVHQRFSFLTNAAELRAFIHSYGNTGPVVLITLQALQVVVAPIPGQILAVVAGYLYGAWLGTLYNVVGITIGSTAAFWLSRRYGRTYVERMVHDDALDTFDGISDQKTRIGLFTFFLVPGLPDDVICFAGGLTRLPLRELVVIAVVGRTPGFFIANVIGSYIGTGRFIGALVLVLVLISITVLSYLNRDRLLRYLS